jgi:putative membrane protein
MKSILRLFLINLAALWLTTQLLPGLYYTGGLHTLILGALGLMVINFSVVPLLKVMFLPLNILTLGVFAWVINVIALYILTTFLPDFKLAPYSFPGANINGFIIPSVDLNVLLVAITASFVIGFVTHTLNWLSAR